MKKSLLSLIAGLTTASFFAISSANAQVAFDSPSLTFLQPTGIVSPTDSIDVNLRFTAGAGGFQFDSTMTNYGLDLGFLSAQSGRQVTGITSGFLNLAFGCSGTFTSSCTDGPPYKFDWNLNDPTPYAKMSFNVAAGDKYDYLFGTFSPSAGPVAEGTYTFYWSEVFANLSGTEMIENVNNPGTFVETDFVNQWFTIAHTCNTGDASCAFTRTVVRGSNGNVPEPGSLALLAVALGILGVIGRRRVS